MRFFLFVNLLVLSLLTYAQDFQYQKFTISDGLAQSQVIALEIDSKEQVWAGTNGGGISVYDGVSFKNYTTKDSLSSNYIYSLYNDSKGKMWIGSNNGITLYSNNIFTQFTNGFKEKEIVYSIHETKEGEIIAGSSYGLKKFENNNFIKYITSSIIDSCLIHKVFIDKDDNIWVGTHTRGIIRYDGSNIKQFSLAEGLPQNTVRTIFQDGKGNIIVGTDRGVCFIDTLLNLHFNKDRNTQTYTDGLLSRLHKVFLINYSGWFLSLEIKNEILIKEGDIEFSEKSLRQIKQDSEGNVWIGTMNGLIKFDSEVKFINYFNSKSSSGGVNSFAIYSNDSNIYIGDYRKGVRVLQNLNNTISQEPRAIKYENLENLLGLRVFSMLEDYSNTLWISSWMGITTYDLLNNTSISYSVEEKVDVKNRIYLPVGFNTTINTSVLFPDSSIWFGTKEGIITYKNGNFSLLSDKKSEYDKLRNIEIIKLYIDGEDVWATTKNGVIKINKNGIEEYGVRAGFVDTQVNDMTIDSEGNLWLSSRVGLFFYDRQKFLNVSKKFNIDFESIYIIQKDDFNNLYVGTNKGLYKFSLNDFYKNDTIILTHYGKEEGFFGVECNRGASFKDKYGNLWFGTVNGVVKYFPIRDKKNTVEPNTFISEITLSLGKDSILNYGDGIDEKGFPTNLELDYNKTHLTFHFISTSKKIPSKVKYQYKLVPLNDEWIPVTNNLADFPILPDGKYTFKVRSCNNDGVWDKTPAEYSFIVNPPFWKTLWFIFSVVVLGVIIVVSYIHNRERKLKKEKEILEQKVTERTKEVVKQKEIVEEKNKDITDSINYAKNIQQALLPGEEDFRKTFKQSLIVYKPRDIVSGDFYWLSTKNKRTFITAADCTGHGVPGAFMSMLGMAFLDQIVGNDSNFNAAQVLNKLRQNVIISLKQGENGKSRDGMDMALSIIDWENNKIEFAGANNPLYIISKDTKKTDVVLGEEITLEPRVNCDNEYNLFEIKPDKMPIGYFLKIDDFTNHTINFAKSDIIFMFSDGYADQFGGEKGKKFKYKKFKQLLLSIANLPVEEQQRKIESTFEEWKKNYEQLDDIIVVGIIL